MGSHCGSHCAVTEGHGGVCERAQASTARELKLRKCAKKDFQLLYVTSAHEAVTLLGEARYGTFLFEVHQDLESNLHRADFRTGFLG